LSEFTLIIGLPVITLLLSLQGFVQHREEDDEERIAAIKERTLQDAQWVLKKVP